MPEVYLRAVRWVADEPQPGIVECRLLDADGVEHVFIEKTAMFDDDNRLRPDASYPIELKHTCCVISEGDTDLVIELDCGIESVQGQRAFRVSRSSIA